MKRLKLFKIFKQAFKAWMDKDPFRESAVIAYYSIFSIPGLFVVIITVAGYFFGKDAVNEHVISQVSSAIGGETGDQMLEIIQKQERETKETSVWGTIIGIATLLVGATGVFAQFQKSLNNIWEVKPDTSKSGILQLLKIRLFSFGLIISIAFLLIISLLVTTLLTAFGDWLASKFSEAFLVLITALNFIISFGILTFLFAMMLKIFPDAKIRWKDVWIGSAVTTILFILGKYALSLYFGKANPASAFGAAGSIILILLWVSYSSMIVFFGAEFTRQYANIHSGGAEPSDHAIKDENRKDSKEREDKEPKK